MDAHDRFLENKKQEVDPKEARRVQREIAKEVANEKYCQIWYSIDNGKQDTILIYAGYDTEIGEDLTHIDNLRSLIDLGAGTVKMVTVLDENGAIKKRCTRHAFDMWRIEHYPEA